MYSKLQNIYNNVEVSIKNIKYNIDKINIDMSNKVQKVCDKNLRYSPLTLIIR